MNHLRLNPQAPRLEVVRDLTGRGGHPRILLTEYRSSQRVPWFCCCLAMICCFIPCHTPSLAQEGDPANIPLHEREPFDRITLDEENQSAQVEIYPIDTIDRSKPVADSGKRSFVIRRIQDPPNRLYSVSATNIVKFELFHELLLDEAKRRIAAQELDEAFPCLARLANEFPHTNGLDETIEDFYLADARSLFVDRRFDEALLSLDQVYARNPRRPGLDRVLQRVLGEILRIEFDAGNFESVARKTKYASDRYGETTKAVVDAWRQRLESEANKQFVISQQAFDAGDASTALAASRRAQQIWPDLEGVADLNLAILAKYPRVRVGVSQVYRPPDPDLPRGPGPMSLDWALRRTEPLVRRGIVEFVEFTADGGQYSSPIAALTTSPDRKQITLSLRSGAGAYELCRSLLRLADPADAAYSPRWAEFLESIFVPTPSTLEINFTRATLRPAALLPRTWLSTNGVFQGDFTLKEPGPADVQSFLLSDPEIAQPHGVREVTEQFFKNPSALTDALISGEIDIIDRVNPLDLAKLSSQPKIAVVPYRIPTVHALVFNDREPLLRSSTFRRGLLYAINRQQFLSSEIIGDGDANVAQVLSGPFPIGIYPDDPLGYAYSRNIEPRDHDPSLALVLLRLAPAQRLLLESRFPKAAPPSKTEAARPDTKPAETKQTEVTLQPEPLPPLVLAYPAGPVARPACTAIAFDLRRIGLNVTIRELEAGTVWPTDNDWDVLYVEATMEEPLVDFPELVLGNLLLGHHGGLVWQATRRLQETANLEEARNQFARIHKISFDHTPILPLWQIIEHVAFRKNIQGIGDAPISLYQHISNWRFVP